MSDIYNSSIRVSKSTINTIILIGIIFLYPDFSNGIYIYIPQIITGVIALYAILKIPVNNQARNFLFFAVYFLCISIFISFLDGTSLLLTIRSTVRLFYPFIAIIIGGLLKKRISEKILVYILIAFVLLELIVCILQFNNEAFREWTYHLYRTEATVDKYLNDFAYSTGRRAIGTLSNPNTLGLTFIVLNSSIIMLSDSINKAKFKVIINLLTFLATTYIVINTQSRTSILLYVFIIAILIYWKFAESKKLNIILHFISGLTASFLFLFMQARINREISISDLNSRFNIWDLRITQMFDYVEYSGVFAFMLGGGFQMARNFGFFDNTFLKVFVSGGIVGVFIFLMVIVSMLKGIKKIQGIVYRRLGWILFIIWIIGSMLVEFQEIFKLSTITFIMFGFVLYSDTNSVNGVTNICENSD